MILDEGFDVQCESFKHEKTTTPLVAVGNCPSFAFTAGNGGISTQLISVSRDGVVTINRKEIEQHIKCEIKRIVIE